MMSLKGEEMGVILGDFVDLEGLTAVKDVM